MESYIDFEYYTESYQGSSIPESEFDNLAKSASYKVRIAIMNRDFSDYESEVKDATCRVAEILKEQADYKAQLNNIIAGGEVLVTSEKVGEYSRSMAAPSFNDLKMYSSDAYTDSLISSALEEFLLFTGLLYRGITVA